MHTLLLVSAKYLYLLIILVALLYWLKQSNEQKLRIVIFGVITAVITYILMRLGGLAYFDPRPFVSDPSLIPVYPHSADNGFPSDHTALSAVIAFTILASSKKLGLALLILAVIVGISRVIGHIHSPIDILGSLVFAAAGAILAYYATPKVLERIRRVE
jgi:undecaprenyl-diphosphatase